ncbi:uncharacterized protein LOC106164867 [Lingula anatina]|uniref:Uncharacterized protein LOC106164867 n=1 Tax=Lingula anatina TaxID=7574 RepID=A0A1S3ILF8_LINAN|nr:uncharacterized protein LOC106164867 [Lingula anatina]|eukprot:XP_013398354.2 uncharacterized protein LOC106164867 [Lingula anatina]
MMRYLREVEFVHLDNRTIAFKDNGEVKHAMYGVKNAQLTDNVLVFNEVGTWVDGKLSLSSPIEMYDRNGTRTPSYVTSSCSDSCECKNKQLDNRFSRLDGGDVVLVGIFDAHLEGDEVKECSDIVDKLGMLGETEAFFYGLDLVNQDPSVLPNVTLGGIVLDNCNVNADRLSRQITSILLEEVSVAGANVDAVPMLGAVSGISSTGAMHVQRFLEVYKLPQISHRSSSPLLSDKARFPHFLRMIASDVAQVDAMIDIMKAMNWTYVITVFSDNAYGRAGMRQFLRKAEKEGLCVATQIMIENYFPSDDAVMENVVQYMIAGVFPNAKVVAMFVTASHARAILQARNRLLGNTSNEIIWLAADAWGLAGRPVSGLDSVARGAITLDFHSQTLPAFGRYLTSLTPETNKRNIWFEELWEQHFGCYLRDSSKYSKRCSEDLSLSHSDVAPFQSHAANVVDGVYVYARSLQNLIKDFCPETPLELCRKARNNLDKVYEYITRLDFEGSGGTRVAFDRLGDGVPRYGIYNFQRLHDNSYGYVKVGTWTEGVLNLEKQNLYYYAINDTATKTAEAVTSSCLNPPCKCSTEEIMDMPFHEQYRDFTLLGYFPLHAYQSFDDTCGALRPEMYQQLLAFYFAIDQINKNSTILGDSVLGFMVWDTCSNSKHGEFVFEAFDLNLRLFNQPPDPPILTNVMAMIGGYFDDVTAAISKANQRGYHLVQISPGATSPVFNNKTNHPRFLRTARTNTGQLELLTSLVKEIRRSVISIVYSNASADEETVESLIALLEGQGICTVGVRKLPDSEGEYDGVIKELCSVHGLTAVIIFASESETLQLLLAGKRQGSAGKLMWISGNPWRAGVVDGVEDVVRGSFTLQPDYPTDSRFDTFLERLTADSFPNDPWYREFWEDHFECGLEFGGKYDVVCRGTESFSERPLPQHFYTSNTINAVYAYALGVTYLYLRKCGKVNVSGCFDEVPGDDGSIGELLEEISKVSFSGAAGQPFSFTEENNGLERYKVLNYQGDAGFVEVGHWKDGRLSLDLQAIKLYDAQGNVMDLPSQRRMSLPCFWYNMFNLPWHIY